MMMDSKKKRVASPVERDGKTYWRPIGSAFVNKDGSINVYLDSIPLNWDGKMQVRDWDESRGKERDTVQAAPVQFGLRALTGGGDVSRVDDTPF